MEHQQVSRQVEIQNAMMESLDELFLQTESSVVLSNGEKVVIEAAKFKHLRHITEFIEEVSRGFDATELVGLIAKVSERQESAIKEGASPFALGTGEMVKEVAGDASILLGVVARGLEVFPKYISLFTNLKEEDVDEMGLEDVALVVFAIFGRNYHFFTQQALPVLQGCIERLPNLKGKSQKGS